jgi:hypothetical protein
MQTILYGLPYLTWFAIQIAVLQTEHPLSHGAQSQLTSSGSAVVRNTDVSLGTELSTKDAPV